VALTDLAQNGAKILIQTTFTNALRLIPLPRANR